MHENKEVFETMPVPRALAKLAVPTIVSQLITMIYNLADTFFIGRTNDPDKVAAATLAFVLFYLLNAIANLFGVGGGSLISRLMGRQMPQEAKKVCAVSFYGAIVASLLYALGIGLFMHPLLRLMGASKNTIGYAADYLRWTVVVGALPTALSMTLAHLLRSEGFAKQASLGLSMGGVLNILLDPLFMFVIMQPGQEVAGAALATLISNVLTLLYFLLLFFRMRRRSILSLSPRHLPAGLRYLGQVLLVGFPTALGNLLASLSNMAVNRLVAGYGDVELAAIGIVKKIDMLPLNVGMGLCQGMMPLVAYNYAARNHARMRASAHYARIAGLCFAALCVLSFELLADPIVRLFIDDAMTVELGSRFLRILCLATPLMFCNFSFVYTLQAVGKAPQSLLVSACRQGLIKLPLLFLMARLFGLTGIIWTQCVADGISLVIAYLVYQHTMRRMQKEFASPIAKNV